LALVNALPLRALQCWARKFQNKTGVVWRKSCSASTGAERTSVREHRSGDERDLQPTNPDFVLKFWVGGWHGDPCLARWGCFLPDLTRLASGSSTTNLPRFISGIGRENARGLADWQRASLNLRFLVKSETEFTSELDPERTFMTPAAKV
jgi:hypothetical protein